MAQAEIYNLLKRSGKKMTALQISRSLGITRCRAYASLRQLKRYGLIQYEVKHITARYWVDRKG